jgi:hypothetical protein
MMMVVVMMMMIIIKEAHYPSEWIWGSSVGIIRRARGSIDKSALQTCQRKQAKCRG